MTIWLASLHPEWAELIKSGEKTMEIRKRIPKDMKSGDTIVFYTTLPVGEIQLACKIDDVIDFDISHHEYVEGLTGLYRHHKIDDEKLLQYLSPNVGKNKKAHGIKLSNVQTITDFPLSKMRNIGITPPQGFINGSKWCLL